MDKLVGTIIGGELYLTGFSTEKGAKIQVSLGCASLIYQLTTSRVLRGSNPICLAEIRINGYKAYINGSGRD